MTPTNTTAATASVPNAECGPNVDWYIDDSFSPYANA